MPLRKRRKRTNAKVPEKRRLKGFADGLWSLAIRDDWNNTCAVCGSGKCEAHHLIPRTHYTTRYDLRNGIALCAPHHKFDANISPHLNAAGWLHWLKNHHPLRHKWYTATVECGAHLTFNGVANSEFYISHILKLRQFVTDTEFTRVCGVRFTEYLDSRKGEE